MKKILILGGGSIGERHLRCFLATGRAQVALCDISEAIRSKLAANYPVDDLYASFDEAVEGSFDAAVICTPANLHVSMASRLAERKIGVLIEKPLSTSLDDIDSLRALCESHSLAVSIAYVSRHNPALIALKSALDGERFGRPVEIVITGGQHFPLYRPAYREIYYADPGQGGGAIQDALTHLLNAAEWLVGPVTRLVADAEHCVLDGVDVEDTVHVITRHGSILGSLSLNQHQPANETTITVICEGGMLRMEGHRSRWLSCQQPGSDWQVEETFELQRDDMFVRQANVFLDQLDGRAEAACSLADGLQTLRVNLAAISSVEKGRWVTL